MIAGQLDLRFLMPRKYFSISRKMGWINRVSKEYFIRGMDLSSARNIRIRAYLRLKGPE